LQRRCSWQQWVEVIITFQSVWGWIGLHYSLS
jgi:hypothetical protein